MVVHQKAAALTLFIAARDAASQREFLLTQQQRYAPSAALKTVRWQGVSLLGFIAAMPPDAQTSPARHLQPALPRDTAAVAKNPFATLCERVDAVVAIGQQAGQAALQDCAAPVLLMLMPQRQVQQLRKGSQHKAVSAIYLEVDPILNLRLVRQLLPQATTVGLWVSPQSQAWLPRLRTEAQRLQLRLEEMPVTDDTAAVRELRHRIDQLDALLLLPDTAIINSWSLKPILLISARHYLPTFGGLTERYVDAGVMAAMVADLELISTQMAAMLQHLAQGDITAPAYPRAVRLTFNDVVARAMSVSIPP